MVEENLAYPWWTGQNFVGNILANQCNFTKLTKIFVLYSVLCMYISTYNRTSSIRPLGVLDYP